MPNALRGAVRTGVVSCARRGKSIAGDDQAEGLSGAGDVDDRGGRVDRRANPQNAELRGGQLFEDDVPTALTSWKVVERKIILVVMVRWWWWNHMIALEPAHSFRLGADGRDGGQMMPDDSQPAHSSKKKGSSQMAESLIRSCLL